MGNRRFKLFNAWQRRLEDSPNDRTILDDLQSLLFVPSHLQRMTPRDPRKGAQRFKTTHVAKRSGRAIPCIGTIGAVEEFPHRVARLKMLQERKERRHATA
jgi:hypothetical protein